MITSRLGNRGADLQIKRRAANILDKKLRATDKSGPPAWGLGVGLKILAGKGICCEMLN
jgi:hypothetical protein